MLLGILGGIAAGALLGVLLAPDSGVNTRKKIATKTQGAVDDLKNRFNHLVNGLSEHAADVTERVESAASRAKSKVS
jgi:gas vesicle protein